MKNVTIFGLILILIGFHPFLSSASQTKGIKVIVKDTSGRKVGLYKGSHALLIAYFRHPFLFSNIIFSNLFFAFVLS